MPRLPLTKKKPSLIDASASYLLTEDGLTLLCEDGQGLLITNPVPPLYGRKATLLDYVTHLLTEDGQHLLAEDGSDLLTTNPPSPLKRKKPPLIVP